MSIKDDLELIIITYNRAESLKKTLKEILSNSCPVKDCKITILNNNSTDSTQDICNEFSSRYKNVSVIKNKYNVGGNANIAKAIEFANKKYFWILGDDDYYDWQNWKEVEDAMIEDHDCIVIAQIFVNPTFEDRIKQCVFLSGCIYKTSIINSEVMRNVYDSISSYCPHAPLFCKVINDKNKSFYYLKGNPVAIYGGWDAGVDSSYTRGNIPSELYPVKSFFAAIFNCMLLIKDDKLRLNIVKSWLTEDSDKSQGVKHKHTDPIVNVVFREIARGIIKENGFLLQNIMSYFCFCSSFIMRLEIILFVLVSFIFLYLPLKIISMFNGKKKYNFWRIK
ncbi:glycosyltransferase family 2 protein [Candidatus Ruminimicrobiellum ovillum]|uniref:glycosyltransferase family 2 protein n=1 Tax=Candidatus Ruminimicrobiellum ovillum TaxID=1947927 RepID=UPI0035595666